MAIMNHSGREREKREKGRIKKCGWKNTINVPYLNVNDDNMQMLGGGGITFNSVKAEGI